MRITVKPLLLQPPRRLLALVLIAAASPSAAQVTNRLLSPFNVSANDLAGTTEPFLVFNTQAPSVRYQQVYQNSDFLRVVSDPFQITELIFSTGAGAINVNVPNVQIDLSTTQKQPDGLSTTFSQNVGSDDSVVLSGSLRLFSRGLTDYGVHVPLEHPFTYDPNAGNL